nr:Fe-S cluster assembly protein SufD [Actinomycetales bacterium]
MTSTITTDHSRATLAGDHTHGAGPVLEASRAARPRSFEVDTFPVPTGREEEWRFSRITDLAPALEDTPTQDDDAAYAATYEVDLAGTPELPTLPPGHAPRGTVLIPGDRPAAVASANTIEAL